MNENVLYIRLNQIPCGVSISENYSKRFVECIQQDEIHESMMVLQSLISVIGELNRNLVWNTIYPIFGCSSKSMKKYLNSLAENCKGTHLFERAHSDYLDSFSVEGSLINKTAFSFEVLLEPVDSNHLSLTVRDNTFRSAKLDNFRDPAAITAVSFAETLYRELYFPALMLLAGDGNLDAVTGFIAKKIDEQFVPLV